MSEPRLDDQLGRDKDHDCVIEWSPDHEEPRLNAWLDVKCDTPDGEEKVSYMYVDGAYVRDHVFVDFVEGGHFYRYGWIPEDQIWIEDILSVLDQVCTGVHEIHERFRMKYKGMNYEDAHDSACKIERIVRNLSLEQDTILPTAEGIARIFGVEGSGKSCESLARELMTKNNAKAEAANKQSNNAEGDQNQESKAGLAAEDQLAFIRRLS